MHMYFNNCLQYSCGIIFAMFRPHPKFVLSSYRHTFVYTLLNLIKPAFKCFFSFFERMNNRLLVKMLRLKGTMDEFG